MAFSFDRTVSNVISDNIIQKTFTSNDRDKPWLNTNVNKLILGKMKWI